VGSFSYRNARICEIDGAVAGMLLSYALPDPYELPMANECPPVVRPLLELESKVPGSWYVNAIATHEPFRGRGVASALMATSEDLARAAAATSLSLIVSSENRLAHGLYLKLGFEAVESRPLVPFPGGPNGGEWLLMVKSLA
jgi:ribosomal protein S18 acetylase RimI-like enzyme